MKKAKAMKLVRALRSGAYHQGQNRLVDDEDRFCCLGVACNISTQLLEWDSYLSEGKRKWHIGGYGSTLHPTIKEEYGFYSSDGLRRDKKPLIIGGKPYDSLLGANDGGCTFDQIADYIEHHWEAL